MPVTNQLGLKPRITPSSSAYLSSPARMRGGGVREADGGGRTNQPARFGGARFGLSIEAQEKNGHAALLSRQHQSSACRKIENPWRSGNFDDQRAKRGAGQSIEACAQNGGHIGRTQQEKPAGIEPQLDKPGGRKLPMLQRGEIRPQPEDPPALGHACHQTHGKPGRSRFVASRSRKNLMQRAFEKSAMQAEISLGVSQRHPRPGVAILQPCPDKAAPQKSDLFRCHIHGRPD
jgi:hypothetical protein